MSHLLSSGNKDLCLLKDSCFHLETKTFVSFDAGGAAQQMGTKSRGFAEAGGESWGHQGQTAGAVYYSYLHVSRPAKTRLLLFKWFTNR